MTSVQVVEKSVTNNSFFFQNYPHRDDHTIRTTEYAGFKAFSMKTKSGNREERSELRGAGRKEKSYPIFLGIINSCVLKLKLHFLSMPYLELKE